MIIKDLRDEAEEGYIRYMASNYAHSPGTKNRESIYDILDVMSGSIYQYGFPIFAYQGSSNPFVIKFRDMQVGDNIRFVFYDSGHPIGSGSKLPVLSVTINGEETLLPSKIPQMEGYAYSAYADYQVMQDINNINIGLFIRSDKCVLSGDIIDASPNICQQGLNYIDVKRTEFNIVKGTPNEGINGTLANGLLAHYSFNDGSLADLSGNGYDLTKVGTVNTTADKDGQTNQAKENTTTSSYLTSEPKSLTAGTDNAVSMWVYIPDLANVGGIFSIAESPISTYPVLLIRQSNNTIAIYASGYYSSYIAITTGWHHIIYNKNKLYIDKQLRTTHNSFTINTYTFLYLFAGYIKGLICKLDEVRVYNRLLTGDRTVIGETATGEIAEIFDMGANYTKKVKPKISEIIFNIDFDKVQLGTYIKIKYLDIKANGVSILDKNPVVKYWSIYSTTTRVLDKEGEMFGNSSTDWYFQAECDGYEPSDIIRKDLKMISIDGYQGDYNGGSSGGSVNYAYHNNDNYKTSEARILIPLTNTSFISYKK